MEMQVTLRDWLGRATDMRRDQYQREWFGYNDGGEMVVMYKEVLG